MIKVQFKIILIFLLFPCVYTASAQTPGFNYQALILNSSEIEIPGTDVQPAEIPLGLEEITVRFTITNEIGIEYSEEHTLITDENGMISVIVGEGAPTNQTFDNIVWDGKLKYLNVELDILGNNEGFVFLDTQKILYLPHPTRIPNQGNSNTSEARLWVVRDNAQRDEDFLTPKAGDQVWNQKFKCLQVYDGTIWISKVTTGANGITQLNDVVTLGGALIQPTEIETNTVNTFALKGLQISTDTNDYMVVLDKTTGVLKQKPSSAFIQQEQVVVTATSGQLQFKTPHPITNIGNIQVFRNGTLIAFTSIDTTTIEIEKEAICYKNDKIRIVQLY
jgi:hypothetical protein